MKTISSLALAAIFIIATGTVASASPAKNHNTSNPAGRTWAAVTTITAKPMGNTWT